MEWQVVGVIVVLVGLVGSLVKPILKLNTSIVKLTDSVDNLQVFLDLNTKELAEHEVKIDDHEHRITVLEAKKD